MVPESLAEIVRREGGQVVATLFRMTGDLDVPGLLARFSQAHPGVEVGLREGIAADMLRFLAADELDAAFCLLAGDVPDGLAAERLTDEEVVAAFAPGRSPPQ